ncbi:MAG: tripartite tricarboxylate transporter TctB family protein [Clostridium sp.]|nr:tripartite tricarboxylate transporter TctB family protein [Clostridium sp.]
MDLKIPIVHSKSHEIFPRITIAIVIILAIIIIIQYVNKSRQGDTKLFSLKGKHFFEENYDKVKLFGTIILLFAFIFLLEPLGFIVAGIIFMSLFNILFSGKYTKKEFLVSTSIAVIETMSVWFIFGYLFEITLP